MKRTTATLASACAVLCLFGQPLIGQDTTVQVQTTEGTVIGVRNGNSLAFLGIPYAASPAGANRFRPPMPHAPWAEPLLATQFGVACPQTASLGSPSDDEDCLNLNVFTPANLSQGMPVLVFFFGGSFLWGSAGVAPRGQGPDYRGDEIAAQTNTIVVTVNYRLGALGFLTSPALDAEGEDHVSGNYGLLDQQAALRWVKANAEAFGGDPAKVTAFGQSAGALSIVYQMVSPAAMGLFGSAELESTGSLATETLATAEQRDSEIVAKVGCSTAADVAACLRTVPVDAFLAAAGAVGPNVDGVVIPIPPDQAIATGKFMHIPVIDGTDTNEGTFFISAAVVAQGFAVTATQFTQTLARNFGSTNAMAIAAEYPLESYETPGLALSSVLTDEFFSCSASRTRAALAAFSPTFGYEFDQRAPVYNYPVPQTSSINDGDPHTAELAYVFGHNGSGAPLFGANRFLSSAMIDALGRFAAQDSASGPATPPQTTAGSADQPIIELGTPSEISSDFDQRHHCPFWQSIGNPTVLISDLP
jgi:para-nitrobenzyl esterase